MSIETLPVTFQPVQPGVDPLSGGLEPYDSFQEAIELTNGIIAQAEGLLVEADHFTEGLPCSEENHSGMLDDATARLSAAKELARHNAGPEQQLTELSRNILALLAEIEEATTPTYAQDFYSENPELRVIEKFLDLSRQRSTGPLEIGYREVAEERDFAVCALDVTCITKLVSFTDSRTGWTVMLEEYTAGSMPPVHNFILIRPDGTCSKWLPEGHDVARITNLDTVIEQLWKNGGIVNPQQRQ